MATCFCKQPCNKHSFPAQTKEGWVMSYAESITKGSKNIQQLKFQPLTPLHKS